MPKVIGDIVGVPNPKSDWNQTDETKADFIRNKPTKLSQFENDCGFSSSGNPEGVASIKPFVINLDENFVGDKTYAEIVEARDNGKTIIGNYRGRSTLNFGGISFNQNSVVFEYDLAAAYVKIVCSSDNEWTFTFEELASKKDVDAIKAEVDKKIENIEVGSLFGDQTKQLDESLFRF